MDTVLVTGGAGFVGSHTCKRLAKAGWLPVVYDDLSNGNRRFVKWGPLEEGSVQDEDRLQDIILRYRPVAVLHFAASIEAGRSVECPIDFYKNNVGGTIGLLRAMRRTGLRTFVFSSTAAVYGQPQDCPIREDHPTNPVSPYGRTKLMVEEILTDQAAAEGLRFGALRYFNAAGADPDGELWEAHEPETHLIPLAIEAAFGRREDFELYGTDYDTEDGTCIRDYVHVSDLADAHVLALQRLLSGGDNIVANLGLGQGFSVQEVIDLVQKVTGHTIPVRVRPRRAGDAASLVADGRQARTELGWTPRYVNLEEQIYHAVFANFSSLGTV